MLLKKLFFNLYAFAGRSLYWIIIPPYSILNRNKPAHNRVRGLIFDDTNNILLVKSWISKQRWAMPGGGIKPGESKENALAREIKEETGVKIDPSKLSYIGKINVNTELLPFALDCYKTKLNTRSPKVTKRSYEILDVGWFPVSNLPKNCSKSIDEVLKLANKN